MFHTTLVDPFVDDFVVLIEEPEAEIFGAVCNWEIPIPFLLGSKVWVIMSLTLPYLYLLGEVVPVDTVRAELPRWSGRVDSWVPRGDPH